MQKVIRYRFGGYLGNRMFEAMLAHSIAERIPGLAVTGDALPEWGLAPPKLALPARHVKLGGHRVDVAHLGYLLREGIIDGIESMALGFRMDLLPARATAERLFPAGLAEGVDLGAETLVISIRAAEILGPRHASYRPLPIAFYARLVAETGLRPAFVGQIADDPYSQALRARFPGAVFLPSQGAMADFATLRRARHLCVSISSFAWLAAWLSEAQSIHLPVAGMYHPQHRKEIDLLPVADPRYRFHLFPSDPWGGTEAELQAAMTGPDSGRAMPREEAVRLAHGMVVQEAQTAAEPA
jgi:hypothetical protein